MQTDSRQLSAAASFPGSRKSAKPRELADFLTHHRRLFVLTGAGCSTDSGIPDYRDERGEWKRSAPIMLQDFLNDPHTRRRYWARSLIGWRRMMRAQPNAAHHSLAALEARGHIELLVTQNVDGLHQRAGSSNVIDLHGRIDTIRCLSCNAEISRDEMQESLAQRNPDYAALDAVAAPDGDADLEAVSFDAFDVPACVVCGGTLKPDVVFFGESVPAARVARAMAAVATCDAMLVVGSSLMVLSGYRFAKAAAEAGKPVAAINIGRTRADELLTLKVSASCTHVLPLLVNPGRQRGF
jgi:NAD-dependent SIR2 family protein deacetylase